ncbi:DUF349 domain-containing protein [Sediminibacter sp. Hel_I_10]|uniref:DUF349 domain-containing protein n=1 Tax=Sediminibacter sp. Hel_I_10 TaxID=1392490 RepID=UPI00047C9AFB|nr:DUF349 domain-containing protein [Sediminibacter sp. Hel_I_10]
MSEQDNLPKADGILEQNTKQQEGSKTEASENTTSENSSDQTEVKDTENKAVAIPSNVSDQLIERPSESHTEIPAVEAKQDETVSKEASAAVATETSSEEKKKEAHVEEIEAANAEDAEDESNSERHELESKDYDKMSMDALVEELEQLNAQKKVQTIKSQVDEIKAEFNSKFEELLEEKKEEFLSEGGNEIDFYFSTPAKKRFNTAYKAYRNAIKTYYKARENDLKSNLDKRLEIIEEIKGLINVEENINTTYKHFKDLQEQWRTAGPIPRDVYNNAWNSYHHHVEIFYDFLHLNRDLRDMDFKHNLDQKLKIIERAEELAKDDNINRAFRELQVLHKLWKEDLGPVAKEHRDEIWDRFSNATKAIHDKRQAYYEDVDKAKEKNLERKEDIISKIEEVALDASNSHQAWQKKIKVIEALREEFFNAGRVPKSANDATWSKFKSAVRNFNRKKNTFYKDLKKDQYENLEKKKALIKIAQDNKDNEDFESTTPLMKKIQSDWKKIGHVPRKDSDKIWKQFKAACNHYFERINAERNEANKELMVAFEKKQDLLEEVKALKLSGERKEDLKTIKDLIEQWKTIGHVPSNKRSIDGKFNKVLDGLFGQLDMDKSKVEMIKFENKLESLAQPNDTRLLDNEQNFIKKRIDELKGEINQLENNLQFFSNVDESNPLVKDVLKNIDKQKADLSTWEDKLRKVRSMY